MSLARTENLRIERIDPVVNPEQLSNELPITPEAESNTESTRKAVYDIMDGRDDRLIVVSGPCSIHDTEAALEYAQHLQGWADRYRNDLLVIMRVYFEKPRTTVGWKGLINDPDLNDTFDINKGLRTARNLLLDLNNMGVAAGTEFLDIISPQYVADLISWGAIGARTTESQVHRELTSGLSCPVGLKNGTNGNLDIAVDGIRAAARSHHFLSLTRDGSSAIYTTKGNRYCHIILRGGKETNFDAASVNIACEKLKSAGLPQQVMIDFSHANSRKIPDNQVLVSEDVAAQIEAGDTRITGVMVESHLVGGRQDVKDGVAATYGQSITDACINLEQTEGILDRLAAAVANRRLHQAKSA
ncbi:MAG: 3-deoxy-7-phosphoheptulonate synthase [Pseudomonadota bacterium]